MKKGVKMEHLGMMISLSAFLVGVVAALIIHKNLLSFPGSLLGTCNGIAYSVGFCMITCYCLKIGPSGPTAAINNLGVVVPVLLGILLSIHTQPVKLSSVLGILLTGAALVLMAFTSAGSGLAITSKWKIFVFLAWLFTGMSLSTQYLASAFDPKNSLSFIVSSYLVSFIVLVVVSLYHRDIHVPGTAAACGFMTGSGQVLTVILLFMVTQSFPGYIVFPMMQIAPIIVMMILGHFLYGEKVAKPGWAALLLSVAGITIMYM